MNSNSPESIEIHRQEMTRFYAHGDSQSYPDSMAKEGPLQIFLRQGATRFSLSITMRTPGNDQYLALGQVLSEGILQSPSDFLGFGDSKDKHNQITVRLSESCTIPQEKIERSQVMSSSCGLCGKKSIKGVELLNPPKTTSSFGLQSIPHQFFYQLPQKLKNSQRVFEQTGGAHGVGLFDLNGNLVDLQEDVGRHNALDKLLGHSFLEDRYPLSQFVLLLSGRISFELIQKAIMGGIQVVAAIGAPSDLAIELGKKYGMTIIGLLKSDRFNCYSHPEILA